MLSKKYFWWTSLGMGLKACANDKILNFNPEKCALSIHPSCFPYLCFVNSTILIIKIERALFSSIFHLHFFTPLFSFLLQYSFISQCVVCCWNCNSYANLKVFVASLKNVNEAFHFYSLLFFSFFILFMLM